MSVKVTALVWDSALPPDEKLLALCLADFANDDGESIYPSQELMAWKCGKSERAVRLALRKLINRGVLVAVRGQGGGRGTAVEYRLLAEQLPQREPWRVERAKRLHPNPARSSGLSPTTNPEALDANPEVLDSKAGSPLPTIRHGTTSRRSTTQEKTARSPSGTGSRAFTFDPKLVSAVTQAVKGRRAVRHGDEIAFSCPVHDDREPSASWNPAKAVWRCNACNASGGAVDLAKRLSVSVGGAGRFYKGEPIIETYLYTDEDGTPLFYVGRTRSKSFPQWRAGAPASGKHAWGTKGVRRVLYRLPRVIAAAVAGDVVWIAEGEKDVHALEAAGVVATCNPGGAGKWRSEYVHFLKGAREIVIVRDKDETDRNGRNAGSAHAAQIAASLAASGIPLTVVEAKVGKDAADHLAAGYGLEEFAPVADVASPADPRQLAWDKPGQLGGVAL